MTSSPAPQPTAAEYLEYSEILRKYYSPAPSKGFPDGSAGKESACNTGDLGSIPELGRSPGEEKGYPLQYSGLENSMDCVVHGVAESRTRLSNFPSKHMFSSPPLILSVLLSFLSIFIITILDYCKKSHQTSLLCPAAVHCTHCHRTVLS